MNSNNNENNEIDNEMNTRRRLFHDVFTKVATIHLLGSVAVPAANAVVVVTDPKTLAFQAGVPFGVDTAKERFRDAMNTIDDLVTNYDTISRDGGDNVRRYLGTVGTTSALYGISKVLRVLQREANDIVVYTECMNDLEYWLRDADTAAYSSMFVEYSAAKSRPEQYIRDAKVAIQHMKDTIHTMALELNL